MNIVVFTGAGLSVESNIPTFEDPEGIFSRYDKNLVAIDYEKLSNNNGGMSIGYLRKMNLVSLGIGLKHIVVEEESHSQFSTGLSFKIKSINLNLALKQNISSDILNPYSRILHCSISYKY